MNTTDFEKLKLTIRSQLIGMALVDKRYLISVRALDYACAIHKGLRKDKVTPEFYHQLSLVGFALTQVLNIAQPWLVIPTLILHDTYEDYQNLEDELAEMFPEVMEYVVRVSKIRRGEKIPLDGYMAEVGNCAISSVVKLIDRLHNLTTMLGVFSLEKLVEYISETEVHYLPMLKNARRKFQEQNALYELLKSCLNRQLTALNKYVELAMQLKSPVRA